MSQTKRVLKGAMSTTLIGMFALTIIPAIIAILVGIPYLVSRVLNAPDWVVAVIVFVEVSFLLGVAIKASDGDL